MKVTIFSLLTIMLLTIAFTTTTEAQRRKHRNFQKNNIGMMCEKLNLTAEQKDKVEALRTAHQKEMVDLRGDLEKLGIEMKELKNKGNLNRKDVVAKVEQLNSLKNKIALKRANHRMDIYELLTPEQKKLWEDGPGFNRAGFREGRRQNKCGF